MRFAASTNGIGASGGLSGKDGAGTSVRNRPQRLPRAKRTGRFPWRLGMICLAVSGLLYAFPELNETGQSRQPSAPSAAAPLPAWIEIPDPLEIFHIEALEFSGHAHLHLARRHRNGGGRQDIFESGGSNRNAPLVNLLIYQPGSEELPRSTFYVDLARRAAESGRAIIRSEQPEEMTTRIGAFEAARIGLARDGGSVKDCLGFRFANTRPDLRITGFACGGGAPVPTSEAKEAINCLLDGIGLAQTADDKGLIDFFAAHYAVRSPNCPVPGIEHGRQARLSRTGGTAPLKRQGISRQR